MPNPWDEREQFWSTLGQAKVPRASVGQPAPMAPTSSSATTAHQFIRDALEQDLPPAVEKAIDSLSPWPTIVIAALIVTAVGVSVLAFKALAD